MIWVSRGDWFGMKRVKALADDVDVAKNENALNEGASDGIVYG